MKTAWLLAVAALVVGCSSPQKNYVVRSKQISHPPLGSISVVHLGDTMVKQGSQVELDVLLVTGRHPLGLLGGYTITEGVYEKTGENQESNFYATESSVGGAGRLEKTALADPTKAVQAYKNGQKLCGISIFNAAVCTNTSSYRFDVVSVSGPNSFQQSLIYSGRIGNRIRLGYREFSGNLARPAFNNEAEYDLSESKVIGYKGARLEVLEATNEFIRFKLISNFNTN